MTEKELQKLKRGDLLEILVQQGREIERLKIENEELQKKVNDRAIAVDQAGSIAEASLQLNGVFEAAQAAAAQYLENIQHLSERQEKICAEMEETTRVKCQTMLEEAEKGVNERWADLSTRLENFYDAHKGLRELMTMMGGIKLSDE